MTGNNFECGVKKEFDRKGEPWRCTTKRISVSPGTVILTRTMPVFHTDQIFETAVKPPARLR